MGLLDIIIGILLIIGFYRGLKRGLFVTLASLVGLVAGAYCAVYFSDYAAGYISRWFNWGERTTNIAAFAVTFVAVISLVSMAGKFLTKIADMAFLGFLNKLLGGLVSAVTYAFILSVLFMFMASWDATEDLIPDEKKETSVFYGPIASIAPFVLPYILKEVKLPDSEEEEDTSSQR